ncbi:MAG: coenzyme F420-0:L-glutamate ligase [Intrasporangiaceae bacterium]|nr:coenzyme F420-0:L-glutamate ligase [Intrasporangiaceae bacterium]
MSVEPLQVIPVPGIPEVRADDDLGAVIAEAVSKVVSKALGLRRHASRDEVIADETVRVVAERRAGDRVTRIVESVAGPVMAAAGVDESNVGSEGGVLVLPRDPDAAAAQVLDELRVALGFSFGEPLGVILSDTAGRPWRDGVVDFALGSAGVTVMQDHRGGADSDGRPLTVTVIAVADEIAAAADLVKAKAGALPVAIVRGLPWASVCLDAPGASSLVRSGPGDWFRLGPVEAIREALGVSPGSPDSLAVGIRSVGSDPVEERLGRVLRLALHGLGADATGTVTEEGITLETSDAYVLGRVVERAVVAAASEDLSVMVTSESQTLVTLAVSARS